MPFLIKFVRTCDQFADILTKRGALATLQLKSLLQLWPIHDPNDVSAAIQNSLRHLVPKLTNGGNLSQSDYDIDWLLSEVCQTSFVAMTKTVTRAECIDKIEDQSTSKNVGIMLHSECCSFFGSITQSRFRSFESNQPNRRRSVEIALLKFFSQIECFD